MRKFSKGLAVVAGIIVLLTIFYWRQWIVFEDKLPLAADAVTTTVAVPIANPVEPQVTVSPMAAGEAITLSTGNFESFVVDCFKGSPCTFADDPLKMHMDFRAANNRRAQDQLIQFMRSQLSNQSFKQQYAGVLKRIIDDFYPAEELQFQQAVYYNYMGDLQTSLNLYLDLEKKQRQNANLRPAPPLNIANLLYDLNRRREALPYYRRAREDFLSGRSQSEAPTTNEMIGYIEERIQAIEASPQ